MNLRGKYPDILKSGRNDGVRPHLDDYPAICDCFSWSAARAALNALPGGDGCNMTYMAVDQHVENGGRGKTTIRWLGPEPVEKGKFYHET